MDTRTHTFKRPLCHIYSMGVQKKKSREREECKKERKKEGKKEGKKKRSETNAIIIIIYNHSSYTIFSQERKKY